MILKVKKSWENILKQEFQKDYMKNIFDFLQEEEKNWKIIYPKKEDIFKVFKKTSLEKIKVVILWQDPYHWENQAEWFCFSVPNWQKIPPSLRNIFKELKNSLNIENKSWDLTKWAESWVFLLNCVLTVEKWKPASHSKIWWEKFSDKIIKTISEKRENVVFLLWWNFAIQKERLIDSKKHFIIKTTHPSPFSANKWFLGSDCFLKTNKFLEEKNLEKIDWSIKN